MQSRVEQLSEALQKECQKFDHLLGDSKTVEKLLQCNDVEYENIPGTSTPTPSWVKDGYRLYKIGESYVLRTFTSVGGSLCRDITAAICFGKIQSLVVTANLSLRGRSIPRGDFEGGSIEHYEYLVAYFQRLKPREVDKIHESDFTAKIADPTSEIFQSCPERYKRTAVKCWKQHLKTREEKIKKKRKRTTGTGQSPDDKKEWNAYIDSKKQDRKKRKIAKLSQERLLRAQAKKNSESSGSSGIVANLKPVSYLDNVKKQKKISPKVQTVAKKPCKRCAKKKPCKKHDK
jgi:hypothetical protein